MKTFICLALWYLVVSSACAQTFDKAHVSTLSIAGNGTDVVHTITLQAPALASGYTLTFPSSSGTGVLTNTAGVLSWVNLGTAILNPMTGPGDMIYGGLLGAATRLAATATANQILLSGSNAAPAWSTATYPVTTTINQLLYSNAANTVTGLGTANNGVLITSGTGVPSIGGTLPAAVQGNITTVGTILSGTWNGTAIGVAYGGTGGSAGAWGLSGNTGIAVGSYLGTTDANDLVFKTVGATAMTIGGASNAGNIGIGIAPTSNLLAVNGNIQMTSAANDKITTNNSDLVLEQTGDTYGTTRLHIQNRNGSNCALFEQAGSVNLADFGFKPGPTGVQSNIRLEDRNAQIRNTANDGVGEFQFYMNTTSSGGPATYNFSTGEAATTIEVGNVGIGLVNPSQKLTLYNGNLLLSNNGTADEMEFQGTGAGVTTFQAGAQGATNLNYTLPIIAPTAGQFLSSTAGGVMSWASALTNPMTGTGDMIYGGAAGVPTRLAATATANQILLSGASAAPTWSTATYPATTTINQILYSNAANTVSGITTGNNGVLATNSSGVPSITATPTLGVAGTSTGSLSLANATGSNTTTIQAGVSAPAATYILPTALPLAANQVLSANGTSSPVQLSWATVASGSSSVITGANGDAGLPNHSQTYYYYPANEVPGGDGKQAAASLASKDVITVNSSGTLSQLYVTQDAAPGTNAQLTYTLYVYHSGSWASTGITVTIAGAAATSGADNTDTYSVSTGDLISMQITGGGTADATTKQSAWSFGGAGASATGMNNPMTTLGDIIYENATPAAARLAGSTTASTKEFLTSTATAGGVAQTPAWGTIQAGDIPTLNQNTTGTANIAGGTVGAIPYQSAANTTTVLAATSTANQVFLSGASAAPSWSTATYPATTTINQLLYSSAANTVTGLGTANYGVVNTNSSGVPSMSASPTVSGVIQSGLVSGGGAATGGLALANSSSTHLTTLQAGNATAAVTYTLPTAAPTTSGQSLTSTTGGTMSWASMPMMISGNICPSCGGLNSTGTAEYYAPSGEAQSGAADATGTTRIVMTRAGTIKNLYVVISAAPGAGKTRVFTLLQHGSASGTMSATVGAAATAANSGASSITVAVGDELSLEQQATGGTAAAANGEWSFELITP